jgi:hypothetical protein
MKKQYFLLIVFIFLGIKVFEQKKYDIAVSQSNSRDKMNSIDSKVNMQYYCIDANPDSLYLDSDSLTFSKTILNDNFPKLKLYENHKFRFTYNIHLDTIKVVYPYDNSIITKVIMAAKEIQGDWKSIDLNKQINLKYKSSTSNFKLIETDKRIYFIKEVK